MRSLDRHLYLDVNSLSRHSGWAHGFMAQYALWGGLVAVVVVFVFAFLQARQHGRLGGVVVLFLGGAGSLIALAANKGISNAVQRARPCHALHHVVVILGCAHDYSFPSDHSVVAGALAAALLFLGRKVGLLGVLLALSVAFARVYAGVHYPGDVLGGLLLGAAIAVVLVVVLRGALTGVALRLTTTPLRPLLAAGTPTRT